MVREQALLSSAVGVVIDPPVTEDCSNVGSGTITFTGDVDDPTLNTIAIGDALVLTFSNCEVDAGLVANGVFDLTIVGFSGDVANFIPPYNVTVDVLLTDFTVSDNLLTFEGDGDMTLTLAGNIDGTLDANISGTALTTTESGVAITLANYLYALSERIFAPFDYTIEMSGELESAALGGSVMFDTLETFTGFGDEFPGTGVLLITGAEGSQCRLTAIDSVNVTVEVDEDGDGVFETSLDETWVDVGV